MNWSLKFKDEKLEKAYQEHYIMDITKQYQFLAILACAYPGIYFVTCIIAFFVSDSPIYYHNIIYLMVNMTFYPLLGLIIYLLTQKCLKLNNTCGHHSDIWYFITFIIIVFADENPFFNKTTLCSQLTYNAGYLMQWTSYERFFFSIFVGFFFKRWTYKVCFFVFNVIYYATFKYEVIHDFIEISGSIGMAMILAIMIYSYEKSHREYFYRENKLLNQQKIWKKILDTLTKGIIILNSEKKILYANGSMTSKFPGIDLKENFFQKITDIKKRKNMEILKNQYNKFLNIFLFLFVILPINLNIMIIVQRFLMMLKTLKPLMNQFLNQSNQIILIMNIFSMGNQMIKLLKKAQNLNFDQEKCILAIFTDLSQRDILFELQQNITYRNIILSTVSHELRTPINSTMPILQSSVEDLTMPTMCKYKFIIPCLRALGMLANLINDILDYAQIQNNKLKISQQTINLKQVVTDACMLIELQYISPEIASSFATDPNRLTQIILNLLSNAVKFTKTGIIKLSLSVENSPTLIKVTVEDTGIGIKVEDLAKLFKEFGRVDLGVDEKLNPTGCGLGLSIVHKFAVLLGPDDSQGIQVTSTFGSGSTFWFIIQDKRKFDGDHRLKTWELKEFEELINNNNTENNSIIIPKDNYNAISIIDSNIDTKKSILIVDDNEFNILSMEMILSSLNLKYKSSLSGDQALEIISQELLESKTNNFAFILMDFNMPLFDGLTVTKMIREAYKYEPKYYIPIIGYTAYNDKYHKLQGLEAGMDEVIEKPISKSKILELLKKFSCKKY